MKTLEVVDSLAGVAEVAESAYLAEVPGFQVDAELFKRVGLLPVLDSIEAGSENALGSVIPFTHEPHWNEPNLTPPHTDGGFRGLAVHHNMRSHGIVQIAHLLEEITQPVEEGQFFVGDFTGDPRFYTGEGIDKTCTDIDHGQIFEGELEPDRLTVFSQGNIEDLPPSIHYFRRTRGPNSWKRYASSHSDGMLDETELLDDADQFRLGYLRGDYIRLWSEKEMFKYLEEDEGIVFAKGEVPDDDSFETGLSLDELKRVIKTHPGRNILVDSRSRAPLPRFKRVSTAGRIVRDISQRAPERLRDPLGRNR